MFSKHVTRDISAYCHGELSIEDSKRFAEHIISCVRCRTKFEEIKLGVKLAEQLPRLSAPDDLWRGLEPLISQQAHAAEPTDDQTRQFLTLSKPQFAAAVAAVLLVGIVGALWFVNRSPTQQRSMNTGETKPSWQVQRLNGTPKIGSEGISTEGRLAVGEWLETDENSRAQIAVGSIGRVDIDENTRVRLLETQPTEHRLELARGKMSARIWAPPRLFFVDTPSAVAADLGCAYTLEVDDKGAGLLRVTSGWVALELRDRESIVPAGAACETRPGVGPGTPYFVDRPLAFRRALASFDFEDDPKARNAALGLLLGQSTARDSLTLWHLLPRVEGDDRVRVYEKLASFWPPPSGVTREGVLNLDEKMLQRWKENLEADWTTRSLLPISAKDGWGKLKSISEQLKEKISK
jgi:FecR protein/Putative zinc-finger